VGKPLDRRRQVEYYISVKKFLGRAVPEEEFSRSQIIQAASKLSKLEKEGLSYEQTLESLRTSSAELKRLEGEVAELRAEEPKLHGRKEELLQANHLLEAESTRLQGRLNAMAVKEKEQEDRLQELGEQVKQCQDEMTQLKTEKNKLLSEIAAPWPDHLKLTALNGLDFPEFQG